jgi:hypothetical protein
MRPLVKPGEFAEPAVAYEGSLMQPRTAMTTLSPIVMLIASLVILVHLGAVVVHTIAAPSGPWGPDSSNMLPSPGFADSPDRDAAQPYLATVRLNETYRFSNIQPAAPGVFIEVKLKDAKGDIQNTIRFPNPSANAWDRQREKAFVQGLAPDQPIAPPEGEQIPAPGQQVRLIQLWDMAGDQALRLQSLPEHLVPRNRPISGPSAWSLVLVRSYARYLCRLHGAASAEVLRHTREPIWPLALARGGTPPPPAFTDLVANYGEIKLDE